MDIQTLGASIGYTKKATKKAIREAVNHFGEEDLNRILINELEEKVKVLMEYRS